MSHDTDKLIRQLSLVAFLMAERRPLTARDVKGCVEGYSEMSDEAFARRFYSDRAELSGLGVPLHSQRDEFTGEELYTLKPDDYFLPPLELTDDELVETKAIVDRLYEAYTNFVAEMYDWVQSHDLGGLRQSAFFRERVKGQISRPLNADELRQHGTPVAAFRTTE